LRFKAENGENRLPHILNGSGTALARLFVALVETWQQDDGSVQGPAAVHPLSRSGGLADMVGALAKALGRAGHQVGLVTPLYAGILDRFPEIQRFDWSIDLPLGAGRVQATVWTLQPSPGLTLYFVDHAPFYSRASL